MVEHYKSNSYNILELDINNAHIECAMISCCCIPHAALQTIVPVSRSVQTAFTARVGDTAILPCPIQPGALSQYYSVIWMKDGVEIIRADNPQTIMPQNGNSRIDLDSTYSLVIHLVNLNDSSSDYQCMLFVTNPNTHTKQEVKPDREITITLNITGMPKIIII